MVVRDVLYGDINIEDSLIESLIRTKEFQRLRNVKQLGLTYMIFPGAEHSRFTHCIGVFNLAREIVGVLEKKTGIRFDDTERKGLFIGCLLHDLGHGPYSHASEHFFKYDHEQLTVDIIKSEKTEINQILKDTPYYEHVIKFISKSHENKTLNSVLSSSIDADRMDYLVRDSHYCGVSYGKFDFSRIMKIIDVENDEIVFHEKGIHTIEDFLLSRYHMFTQVYLNEKSIGYELLIREVLSRIKQLYTEGYEFKVNLQSLFNFFESDSIDVENFLNVDDVSLQYMINQIYVQEEDSKLKRLCHAFVSFEVLEPEVDELEFSWQTEKYSKAVYNGLEPIKIKMETGEVKLLEEVSPIIKLFKEEVRIVLEPCEFGLRKL